VGGNGGGAIILRVHTLVNNGKIRANGASGGYQFGSGGGGGSGGLVLIVADHVLGDGTIEAKGGLGGSVYEYDEHSWGGRGGDGHIIIRSPDVRGQMKCTPNAKIENTLDFPDLSSLDQLK
jgi:hypothetical protein